MVLHSFSYWAVQVHFTFWVWALCSLLLVSIKKIICLMSILYTIYSFTLYYKWWSQYLIVPACQSIPFGWWWEVGWSRDRSCFYWVHWGMKKFYASMVDTYYFFYMALLSWIHHFSHLLIFSNPKYLFASKSFLVTVLLFVRSSF